MMPVRPLDKRVPESPLQRDQPFRWLKSETKFYAEDGWVFREHPGKPIECVARYEDANAEIYRL